ncbi:DinB family protein [Mucilaginibacter pedocola]|uniref:Damage-inducible protein DinB n=1 Tax=Mucilaginibacter pedocola TaxID=1792845 RepID=A0A1S9PGX8_9SPHI|nr:DinB family protein [Mucilaginibacter pedocola]OOQ60204.1 damage-inducible protein DinB [Mucilaginibacter pedocola]
MTTIEFFLKQLNDESITTRKMLARIPNDAYDYKPHPKSMPLRNLATHIAELPTWIPMAINTDELDFAAMEYTPTVINNTEDLMALFEKSLAEGLEPLVPENEAVLDKAWTLRNGNQVYSRDAKWEVMRMAMSQIIHHRAQLGVYLRLLDVPIPGSYGPSADETFEPIEILETA